MARNGSGTYALADTIDPGDQQSSTVLMSILNDIKDALTGSVAANGETTLTGALKAADGSASAPGYGFASDTNTGFYRKGADNVGAAAGGAIVWEYTTSGIVMASGKTISAPDGFASGTKHVLKPGDLVPFAGPIASLPSGRLLCDGSAVSRTTYAALFAVLGTIHGAGNGSTTFNLPDLRDKFVIGAKQDDSGTPKTNVEGSLTQTGGSKDAVNVSHTHTASSAVTDPGHTHNAGTSVTVNTGSSTNVRSTATTTTATGSATTGITVATTVDSAGSSGTNANLPPYYAMAWTIVT